MFKDDDIRAYFESQAWYAGIVPADQFSESVLSKTEKTNISTIKAYEDYLDGDSDTGGSTVISGDYIIPDSSTRYLSDSDVRGLMQDMDVSSTMLRSGHILRASRGIILQLILQTSLKICFQTLKKQILH